MIDFSLPPELADLRERTAAFVRDEVIPQEPYMDEHDGLPRDRLDALRAGARAAGLYAPHVPREWGGLGLGMREMAVVFEQAGRSLLGPVAGNPGYRVIRQIPSLDAGGAGGHCEVAFRDCEVGEDAALGEVGQGFAYAQVRLAPARLTHCMRWLGVAQRAHEIAVDYANGRESFGKPLAQHQMVQQMIADSAMELHASRLMIWHAAWVIDGIGRASSRE